MDEFHTGIEEYFDLPKEEITNDMLYFASNKAEPWSDDAPLVLKELEIIYKFQPTIHVILYHILIVFIIVTHKNVKLWLHIFIELSAMN